MSSRVPVVPIAAACVLIVVAIVGAIAFVQPTSPAPSPAGATGTRPTGDTPTAAPTDAAVASGRPSAPSSPASAAGLPSPTVPTVPSPAISVGPLPTGSAAPASAPPASPAPASATPSAPPASAAPSAPPLSPSPSVAPTASATPSLVRAPLTGVLVPRNIAARHVIAVMIDDLSPARPQSGFTAASVVWQAPAEGGIPRYMLLFQDGVPKDVGPVRSARYYFIGWAAEWRAAYAHAGGSPQALRTLRTLGRGQLVYNVDEFSWGSSYFWRIHTRYAPHNLYTNGARLRLLANTIGATSVAAQKPAWTFAPERALEDRPTSGTIETDYFANHIRYAYDRATNTYLRSVSPGVKQVDASTGRRVAPKNVVVMFVRFGALNDNHPEKGRLEAQFVGSGRAYVATNGRTVTGRWVKSSLTGPTRFVDATGRPIPLSPGQTFIQVMPTGSRVVIADGRAPAVRSPADRTARPA